MGDCQGGEDEDEFVSGNDLESNHLKHMHIGLETKLARRKNQVPNRPMSYVLFGAYFQGRSIRACAWRIFWGYPDDPVIFSYSAKAPTPSFSALRTSLRCHASRRGVEHQVWLNKYLSSFEKYISQFEHRPIIILSQTKVGFMTIC